MAQTIHQLRSTFLSLFHKRPSSPPTSPDRLVIYADRSLNVFIYFFFPIQDMKEMLYKIIEEAPSAESTDPENLHRRFTQFDEHFLQYCEKELAKINVFYSGLYS